MQLGEFAASVPWITRRPGLTTKVIEIDGLSLGPSVERSGEGEACSLATGVETSRVRESALSYAPRCVPAGLSPARLSVAMVATRGSGSAREGAFPYAHRLAYRGLVPGASRRRYRAARRSGEARWKGGNGGRAVDLAIGAGLVAAVLLVFSGVLGNRFVNFDDPLYITGNPVTQKGLSASTVAWAFTTVSAANWHPLTWLSVMLDIDLFGLDPRGHHAMSLGIHALNTVLVFACHAAARDRARCRAHLPQDCLGFIRSTSNRWRGRRSARTSSPWPLVS